MTRVKGGVNALKRRKNVLRQTKGFRFGRSTKERQAKEALVHAGSYSFAHRKDKKADNRRLWQVRINAAVRTFGTTYSKFIDMLKKKEIEVDRKILAGIAETNPETFARIMDTVK
ncbi:MAG: 50S ribosomal protein L20 [Candidatus Paceibacterota bacterium]|jgi:large subunit ribosomal protein L20